MFFDWISLFKAKYEQDFKNDGYFLFFPEPRELKAIRIALSEVFFVIPNEIEDFYLQSNGVKIVSGENGKENALWHIPPISQLKEFVYSGKDWMLETHPDIAQRFVPIISWFNGDYAGYLLSEDLSSLEGFFEFNHEVFDFDECQNYKDFLKFIGDDFRRVLMNKNA